MAQQRGLVWVASDVYRLAGDDVIPDRVIELASFGVALHELIDEPAPGADTAKVCYRHAGLVQDLPTAIAWLRGEDVEIIRIYPVGTDGESAEHEKED